MSDKHILIIEDNQDLRIVARMSLEFGGYRVTEAACGSDGLDAARSDPADLILLDMMMPGMDGPETLRRLRAGDPPVTAPVVFFSAKAKPEEIADAMKLDVSGYITKPFDPMELPGKVAEFLG
jgi:CheY-like chemotaxis protein